MPSIHDAVALERFRRAHRLDPHRIQRLRIALYKRQRGIPEVVGELPAAAAVALQREFTFEHLGLESRHDSARDGASKLLFTTHEGHRIEAVILRILTGRTSLCVSSQVGCRAACAFCATGRMGLQRDLTADEIVDQVLLANRLLVAEQRSVRNVVFMGMGEPLHNEAQLHAAIELLVAAQGCHFSPGRLLVSTVGVPDAMLRLARRFPQVRIALSLHAATQEVREAIVPLARRHPLEELRAAVATITANSGREVMIEYVLLRDRNDRPEDLAALLAWCEGLNVHINLIPYNAIDDARLDGTAEPERLAFAQALKAAGHVVTMRYSLGADVTAACGQLVRKENRRR